MAGIGIVFVIIYTLFIFYVTLYPFHFKGLSLDAFLNNAYRLYHPSSGIKFIDLDLFANIFLFSLFGAVCGYFFARRRDRDRTIVGVLYVGLYILFINSIIEILQANIPDRVSSPADLLVSVAASMGGFFAMAVLKDTGVIERLKRIYYPLLYDNPARVLWLVMAAVFVIGGTYPYAFVPRFSYLFKDLDKFDLRLFRPYFFSTRFFMFGLPYFVWGMNGVMSAFREEGIFEWNVFRRTSMAIMVILAIEYLKIFIATRQPSVYNIEAYSLCVMAGALIAYRQMLKFKRYPLLLKNEKARKTVGNFFWICSGITVLLIVMEGLYPFIFRFDIASIQRHLHHIELIPFKGYINYFNIFTVDDAMNKSALYLALGLEIGYYILKRHLEVPYPLYAVSGAIALVSSAGLSLAQLMIPLRIPSISYIIISVGSAAAGAWLAKFIFKCSVEQYCA